MVYQELYVFCNVVTLIKPNWGYRVNKKIYKEFEEKSVTVEQTELKSCGCKGCYVPFRWNITRTKVEHHSLKTE